MHPSWSKPRNQPSQPFYKSRAGRQGGDTRTRLAGLYLSCRFFLIVQIRGMYLLLPAEAARACSLSGLLRRSLLVGRRIQRPAHRWRYWLRSGTPLAGCACYPRFRVVPLMHRNLQSHSRDAPRLPSHLTSNASIRRINAAILLHCCAFQCLTFKVKVMMHPSPMQ